VALTCPNPQCRAVLNCQIDAYGIKVETGKPEFGEGALSNSPGACPVCKSPVASLDMRAVPLVGGQRPRWGVSLMCPNPECRVVLGVQIDTFVGELEANVAALKQLKSDEASAE
jgi:hypothetical protein